MREVEGEIAEELADLLVEDLEDSGGIGDVVVVEAVDTDLQGGVAGVEYIATVETGVRTWELRCPLRVGDVVRSQSDAHLQRQLRAHVLATWREQGARSTRPMVRGE